MKINNKEFVEHSSGLYVSRDGEVFIPRSGKRKEHLTYGCNDKDDYLLVGYKRKSYKVHRLVAETFIPNPNNLPFVNHRDENPSNNNVDNLEWCTRQYNINYGTRTARQSAKLSKKVLQLTLNGQLVKEWQSTQECGRNGYNQGAISLCCNGKLPHYKKFKWQYA